MALNFVAKDLAREHPEYSDLIGRVTPTKCAYSSPAIKPELDRVLVDAGVASWRYGTYTQDITEVVLVVLAHPKNRTALRELVQQIEERFPEETE